MKGGEERDWIWKEVKRMALKFVREKSVWIHICNGRNEGVE